MGMIDVKIIKKAKQSGGVLTPGTGSRGGYAGGTPSGEAAEAGHALRADFADLADRANRAAEADHAKEADHAASARDLDSDSPAFDRFIRKDQDDRTPYQLASDVGFDVGQFLASVSGGRFGIDKVTGQSFLEVDRIFARVRAYFESLTVVERESLAGEQMVTPGGGVKCTSVEEVRNGQNVLTGWRCYFLSEQDGEKRETKIIVGDQAIAQTFNAKAGTTNKVSNHRWWRLVTGVSNNAYTDDSGNVYGYIEVSATDCETDSDTPKEGDDVIQFGNRTDKTRQAAILISTVASDAPSIKLLTGIDHYSLVGKDIISQGYDAVKGHAYFRCYGDTYIGAPDGSTYVKYDVDGKKLTVKADLEIGSTIGGKGVSDFVTDLIPEIPELTQEDIEDYVNNIVDPKIEGIQNQIDGVIETWFYNGVPSLSNYPASEWNTEALKTQHLGDLYYDNDTGTAYRFSQKADKSYYWNVITDDAITKALAAAKKAQDTADGKRRTFTSQPTPPYDKGDIWVNATYPAGNTVRDAANGKYVNDILRCNTSRATGSFAIGDWGLASNYTDDTAALAAAQAAKAAKDAADAAQSAANAAQSSVTSLNNYVDGAFKDGIIDETEASGIANYINIVNADKERIDGTYQTLYANAYLSATGKAALKTAHDDVAAKISALINAINSAIADNKVTAAESAAVNNAFSAFSTSNKTFSSAVETANEEIQRTLKSAADAAKTAADNAKATADAAQTVADAAKDRLDSWAADGVISPTEKQAIKDEIARIDADKAHIAAEYTRYSLGTPTDYNAAHSAYRAQLVTLSASTPENITIPPYFSANQTAYYNQRTAALSAIATAAKKYADDVAKEEATKATDAFKYLKESLLNAQQETTEISGGLILSTMMALGYTENGARKILSGMNGSYVSSLGGRTIATWYGGHMLDLFDKNDVKKTTLTGQEATSLIRMDGSAYFANGNIGFRADGSGWLAGNNITWDASGAITFGNGIHIDLGSGNSTTLGGLNTKLSGVETTVGSVLTLVNALSNVLVPVNASGARVAWDSADLFAVKSVKGFYSEEFISARGLNGQSSSISKYLTDLLDVGISAPSSGQALVYNGSKWVNQAIQTGLDETALASYLTTNNYAKKSDIPSLANYVTLDTAQTISGVKTFATTSGNSIWLKSSDTFCCINYKAKNGTTTGDSVSVGSDKGTFYVWTEKTNKQSFNINQDGLATFGFQVGSPNGSEVNRICIVPYGHTGGPWYISSYDTTSTAYLRIKYGSITPFAFSHDGTLIATKFQKVNGTSSQFLKADGSVDSNTYLTSHQSLANYYTKSEVDAKDKRLTTYYASRPASANVNFGNNAGLYTFLATSSMTTGKPAADAHILHMEWDNSLSYAAQIAVPSTGNMQWRYQNGTAWQAWRTLLDTSNFNTLIGSNLTDYVKKAGDTMTGSLRILGTSSSPYRYVRVGMQDAESLYLHNGYTDGGRSALLSIYNATTNKGGIGVSASRPFYQDANASLFTLLHSGNYSSILDSRYYTESEINTKLTGYLARSGGNMTGNIGYTGSKATYTMISFIDNTADAYGNGIAIGGGGATIIGGGEAADLVKSTLSSGGDEKLILCNDQAIDIYTNCQNGLSSATHTTISGNLFSGVAANANSLGGVAASQYARITQPNNFVHAGNEITMIPAGFTYSTKQLWINYRCGADGSNANFNEYVMGNGTKGGTASVRAASFIKSGGSASQFLKADGSVDANSYLTTGSAASTYVKKAGDTMSGLLTISHALTQSVVINSTTGNETFLRVQNAGSNKSCFGWHPTYGTYLYHSLGAHYIGIRDNGSPYFDSSLIWHAGNDGSGSGLDADLLDGYHATSFARLSSANATVGASNRPVYLNAGTVTAVSSVGEAFLSWGGQNYAGTFGPLDAAISTRLGANRFAFANPNGTTFQYSTNGGSSWTDYGLPATQKRAFFDGAVGATLVAGKAADGAMTTSHQLRVIINTGSANIYTVLNKFIINVSTNGVSGLTVTIERALQSTPTSFVTAASNVPLNGWSGFNVVNVAAFTTYGNQTTSQYGVIRFTFKCTGAGDKKSPFFILSIMGFGGNGWTAPSQLALNGHLYSYDGDQNATFPAKVTASSFAGSLSGNASSATQLQTARTIWGQSFNGTGNVSGSISGCPRIYNAASNNMYLGNSDNSGWVLTQNICSHSAAGDTYWSLRSNGTLHCKTALVGTTTASYALNCASFICDSWVRSKGATGWYNESYGGGWYMTDSTWIRNYGNKALYMSTAIIRTDYRFDRQGYAGASWNNGYGAYNVAITNNDNQTPLMVAYRAGQNAAVTGANRLFALELLNSGGDLKFAFGGAMKFKMTSAGVFYAKGGIYSDGYVSARGQNTSDIRLKSDIAPFRASDIIKTLRPVKFKWNANARSKFSALNTAEVQYGLIAQEAIKVTPSLVNENMFGDGYMGIRYEGYIPILMQAQKETIQRTETLEQKVNRLEAENRELKAQISQLKTQLV